MSFVLDDASKVDYGTDWTAWLNGDTITASTWTISPQIGSIPALTNSTFDATTTTVWVDNAELAGNYRLVNHITTAAGREHDCTIWLRCRAR